MLALAASLLKWQPSTAVSGSLVACGRHLWNTQLSRGMATTAANDLQGAQTSHAQQSGPSSRDAGIASTTDRTPSSSNTGASFGARRVARAGAVTSDGRPSLNGIVHIGNTNNNIILTLTDLEGNAKAWTTAATVGFRNARKSLPAAAEKAAEELAARALKLGYGSVIVKLKGIGTNKQNAVASLHAAGLRITQLQDVTAIPYNGCRAPKRRRV